MCNRRDLLDRIITFVSIMVLMLMLMLTYRHNHYTTITVHNDNNAITYTTNYYDLSYHVTHFMCYIDVGSFVQKQPRDINMTGHSGSIKG